MLEMFLEIANMLLTIISIVVTIISVRQNKNSEHKKKQPLRPKLGCFFDTNRGEPFLNGSTFCIFILTPALPIVKRFHVNTPYLYFWANQLKRPSSLW